MSNNPVGEVMITSFHHTRSDFKVFWNIDNVIDFFIRDYDRKIKSINGESYAVIITNPKTGALLMQRPLVVADAALGHVRLTLSAADSLSLPIGNLRYSIVMIQAGKTTLLYTDRDHGPQSSLEVKYGPLPAEVPPTLITMDDFATIDGSLRAGSYQGPSMLADGSNMRTFLISSTALSGEIIFEASLSENVPSSSLDWFVAHTEFFNDYTGTRTVNLEGNYAWVRIALMPVLGTLDEILLK
jgi:hypothetical protein